MYKWRVRMMVMVGGERDGKHECEWRQRKQTQHSEIDNPDLNTEVLVLNRHTYNGKGKQNSKEDKNGALQDVYLLCMYR